MSAPAASAASTSARARSSEPSWLTPASAMMRTRPPISSRPGKVEEALARQRPEVADRGQDIDDAARAVAGAIGIRRRAPAAPQRFGDGGRDGLPIGRAGDHRFRLQPAALAVADID